MAKRRMTKPAFLLAAVLTIAAVQTDASAKTDETEALQDGQRMAVIRVVAVTGNELTYYEVGQEEDIEETAKAASETAQTEETAQSERVQIETEQSGRVQAETAAESGRGQAGPVPGDASPNFGTDSISEADAQSSITNAESEAEAQDSITNAESEADAQGSITNAESEADAQGSITNAESEAQDSGTNAESTSGRRGGGEFPQGRRGSGDFFSGQPDGKAETMTQYLPVAVVVHTDIGEEKTFTILEAGDELEVLLEETGDGGEMITEIWMKSTEGEAE